MSKSQFPIKPQISNSNNFFCLGFIELGFDWLLVIGVWSLTAQLEIEN
jgi:hypothetical protein